MAVSSEFLKDGVVFLEQDMHGVQTPQPVTPGGEATDIPVVVLSAHPGRVVADLPVPLQRPRNKRDEGFDELVDSIFEKIV